jgi:YD repeat-containing protein
MVGASYDALGRRVTATETGSAVTRTAYNSLNQVLSVTDPRGLMTRYDRNAWGEMAFSSSPDSGGASNSFDLGGNMISSTDARGQTVSRTFDALNRPLTAVWADQTHVWTWDTGQHSQGRLAQVSDGSGRTTWTWDASGRVLAKTHVINTGATPATRSFAVAYGWNTATGQLRSITYPSGRVVNLSYDAAGRISSLVLGPSTVLLSGITWSPFGNVTGWTWGLGGAVTRTYDLDGRLTKFPMTPTSERRLTYDSAGRITRIFHPTSRP